MCKVCTTTAHANVITGFNLSLFSNVGLNFIGKKHYKIEKLRCYLSKVKNFETQFACVSKFLSRFFDLNDHNDHSIIIKCKTKEMTSSTIFQPTTLLTTHLTHILFLSIDDLDNQCSIIMLSLFLSSMSSFLTKQKSTRQLVLDGKKVVNWSFGSLYNSLSIKFSSSNHSNKKYQVKL